MLHAAAGALYVRFATWTVRCMLWGSAAHPPLPLPQSMHALDTASRGPLVVGWGRCLPLQVIGVTSQAFQYDSKAWLSLCDGLRLS
jgi:hypothetical protein